MMKDPGDEGFWKYSLRIGNSGEEEFKILRDRDKSQAIYPAKPRAMKTSIPIRGPDNLDMGKAWLLRGSVGEVVNIRFEVDDAKFVLTVNSESKGESMYESLEGWLRREYSLAASWNDWMWQKMEMDPDNPGVFKFQGVIGQNYSETYRGFCEFFTIAVDEDENHVLYPEVANAGSGETMVMGPGPHGVGKENQWMVRTLTDGAMFEVVLDVNSIDRRKIVTWTWDAPQRFGFPILEDGRIGGGAIMYDVDAYSTELREQEMLDDAGA